jgi:predicted small lipoprotein YifL
VFIVAAVLVMSLAGCEYSGPPEQPPRSSSPSATPQPQSFEENVDEVARLLEASPADPGMPSEAEPNGKLSLDLAPGDYLVTGACAGVYGAKLTVVKADGVPEAASFECDSRLDRFVRHDGGPITISAVPPIGRPAATGVKVQTNPDRRASELEDISEWAAQQLQPPLPGELRGTSSGNTTTTASLTAPPGQYELHLVCAGLPVAELSVSTWKGVEVLAPVQVPCSGSVFKAPVVLPTEGADLTMGPGGLDSRFAYRLVPTGQP